MSYLLDRLDFISLEMKFHRQQIQKLNRHQNQIQDIINEIRQLVDDEGEGSPQCATTSEQMNKSSRSSRKKARLSDQGNTGSSTGGSCSCASTSTGNQSAAAASGSIISSSSNRAEMSGTVSAASGATVIVNPTAASDISASGNRAEMSGTVSGGSGAMAIVNPTAQNLTVDPAMHSKNGRSNSDAKMHRPWTD